MTDNVGVVEHFVEGIAVDVFDPDIAVETVVDDFDTVEGDVVVAAAAVEELEVEERFFLHGLSLCPIL